MYISRTRCCYRDCLHIMQGLLQLVPEKSPTLLCKCANVANSVVEMDYLTLHCVVTFVILILCMMFYLGCFPYRIVAPLLVIRCYIVQHGYCAPPTPHEQFLVDCWFKFLYFLFYFGLLCDQFCILLVWLSVTWQDLPWK